MGYLDSCVSCLLSSVIVFRHTFVYLHSYVSTFFFFFQAEDGIRDWSVTGVQTCALPIYPSDLIEGNAARDPRAVPRPRRPRGRGSLFPIVRTHSRILRDVSRAGVYEVGVNVRRDRADQGKRPRGFAGRQVRIFVHRSANRSTASSWKLERFAKRSFRTSSRSLIENTLSRSRRPRRRTSRCMSFWRW